MIDYKRKLGTIQEHPNENSFHNSNSKYTRNISSDGKETLTRLPKYISSDVDYSSINKPKYTLQKTTTSGLIPERNYNDYGRSFGTEETYYMKDSKYKLENSSVQNRNTYTPSYFQTGSSYLDDSRLIDYSRRESTNTPTIKVKNPNVSYMNYLVDLLFSW